MTTKQVLTLDMREEGNEEILQKCLRKIKQLAEYDEEVPLSKIEKLVKVMCKKYSLKVFIEILSNEECSYFRSMAFDRKARNEIEAVYGLGLYEVMAKTLIMLYSYTRKEKSK